MRLFDLIAQSDRRPLPAFDRDLARQDLPVAGEFADCIRSCPRRLVVDEDLTRICTSLAFSEGDRLESCVDLIRAPLPNLWVEWPDGAHCAELIQSGLCDRGHETRAHRAGVLISADASGRRGELRTFWTSQDATDEPVVAPVRVLFDLDGGLEPAAPFDQVFGGGLISVDACGYEELSNILSLSRLRFDERWRNYYAGHALDPAATRAVVAVSVGAVATTFPMLLALFLLMSARGSLQQRDSDLSRLNRARRKNGRSPLLEHTEVRVALGSPLRGAAEPRGDWRRRPRLHHVRGHLVRRGTAVFWRSPHLRGHKELGVVKSQTTLLTSPHPDALSPFAE